GPARHAERGRRPRGRCVPGCLGVCQHRARRTRALTFWSDPHGRNHSYAAHGHSRDRVPVPDARRPHPTRAERRPRRPVRRRRAAGLRRTRRRKLPDEDDLGDRCRVLRDEHDARVSLLVRGRVLAGALARGGCRNPRSSAAARRACEARGARAEVRSKPGRRAPGIAWLDAGGVVATKALTTAAVVASGFSAVSDDDYARVVIALRFADAPALDPTG